MVNLPAIYISNTSALILLFILLFSSRKVIHYGLFDNKLFHVMVYSTIIQSVTECLTFVFDGHSGQLFRIILITLNSLLFINNIFFSFIWTVYADYKLFADMDRIRRIYRYVAIPAVFVAVCTFINLFSPVFFIINENNVYQRSGMYPVSFILSYFYLIYGVLLIYFFRKKVNKYLFLPALIFMIPIVIASLCQYFVYGISVLWLGTAIALVSIYINIQNEVSSTDQLSGLFTSQYMNKYLNMLIRKNDIESNIAGVMLDIDNFKLINDTFGHLVGDEAIRTAGRILHSSVTSEALAARYAGDEFVIIIGAGGEARIKQIITEIKKESEKINSSKKNPYSINFSLGYGTFDIENDTIDSFLGRLDAAMYADKVNKKSSISEENPVAAKS